MVAKKWISLLIEFMLSKYLFVDVPVTGTFSESCTRNGTFWEFSQKQILRSTLYNYGLEVLCMLIFGNEESKNNSKRLSTFRCKIILRTPKVHVCNVINHLP